MNLLSFFRKSTMNQVFYLRLHYKYSKVSKNSLLLSLNNFELIIIIAHLLENHYEFSIFFANWLWLKSIYCEVIMIIIIIFHEFTMNLYLHFNYPESTLCSLSFSRLHSVSTIFVFRINFESKPLYYKRIRSEFAILFSVNPLLFAWIHYELTFFYAHSI